MPRDLQNTRWSGFGAAAVLGGLLLASVAGAADPVDELRRALPVDDVPNPTDAMLKYRQDKLSRLVASLKTVGELRRALALNDWRDAPHYSGVADEKIRIIDSQFRSQIGGELTRAFERLTSAPDANAHAKVSVAALIADMGVGIRSLGRDDRSGYARTHTALLIKLTQDKDAAVRLEALRALGNINAEAKTAAATFAGALQQKSAGVAERRLAAEGLAQMVRVAGYLQKSDKNAEVQLTKADAIQVFSEVVRTSVHGFGDADAQVRLLAHEAFRLATQTFADDAIPRTYGNFDRKHFPPADRPLAPFEVDQFTKLYNETQDVVASLAPMFATLRDCSSAWTETLRDADAGVRLAAMNSLKEVATAWQRLRRHVLGLPHHPERGPATKMLARIDPLEPTLKEQYRAVAPLLSAPDSQLRRAAATYLLLLEERAAPMLEFLVAGLTDQDRAIRWLAARTLVYLPVEQTTAAIPNLAKLLFDADLTLRITAAETLKNMGPLAKDAVDRLADATLRGDADGRLAAMQALTAIGAEHAKSAVPKLIDALGQSDADVKVIAGAAETLGRLGPAAAPAIPALRRLIGHENPDVRTAASEAILGILTGR